MFLYVDNVVSQYNEDLSKLLDKHAPQKKIQIVDRPLNDWMNDDIQALKEIRRKKEDIWRKNLLLSILKYIRTVVQR